MTRPPCLASEDLSPLWALSGSHLRTAQNPLACLYSCPFLLLTLILPTPQPQQGFLKFRSHPSSPPLKLFLIPESAENVGRLKEDRPSAYRVGLEIQS